jgi:two-component system C4-dicarboxylate transport response regulator DctD
MADKTTILFVDDEAPMRESVKQWLELSGFDVIAEARASAVLPYLHANFAGILITDLRMPDIDGLALLKQSQAIDPDLPVVMITGHGDIETAVESIRLGAYDFIEKPFVPERFLDIVRRAVEKRRLVIENRLLRSSVNRQSLSSRIIGTSRQIESLRATIAELASVDANVIIYGETGSGKDLVARCLHDFGPRAKENYVAINCAAVPETMAESELFGHEAGAFTHALKVRIGKFEFANRGTLFLDEIDSMPLALQGKILRALQDRVVERLGSNKEVAVNVRAIASSKIDLRAAGEKGTFRSDLYFRLSTVELVIPPLRDRPEDIPLLFEYFAASAAEQQGRAVRPVPSSVLAALMSYRWPGNVRELRNAAERYVLGLPGAPLWPGQGAVQDQRKSLAEQVEAYERSLIERALVEAGGSVAAVMEQLDVPRRTLSEKMARFGIDRKRATDRPKLADDAKPVGEK